MRDFFYSAVVEKERERLVPFIGSVIPDNEGTGIISYQIFREFTRNGQKCGSNLLKGLKSDNQSIEKANMGKLAKIKLIKLPNCQKLLF